MNKTIEFHRKEYATSDFLTQCKNYDAGLYYENYYIEKHFKPNLSLLEIGTGGGRIAFALEKEGFHNITAIDFVNELIDHCIMIAESRNSLVIFQVANAISLPYEDNSFDQIICSGVMISHLPKRELRIKALREAYRVLKPNGIIFINSHNIYFGQHVYLLRFFTKIIRMFYNPWNYDPNDLPRMGAKSGKIDLLFFKPNKGHLHYYYPAEIIYDILSVGFNILEMNKSGHGKEIKDQSFHFFRNSWLEVVAKK